MASYGTPQATCTQRLRAMRDVTSQAMGEACCEADNARVREDARDGHTADGVGTGWAAWVRRAQQLWSGALGVSGLFVNVDGCALPGIDRKRWRSGAPSSCRSPNFQRWVVDCMKWVHVGKRTVWKVNSSMH